MSKSDFDLTFQNQCIESKIVASLERISQSFRVLLWQECKEHLLSPIQIQVLIFLLTHNEQNRKVSYLAAEFNMSKATISETIKTLFQKKLISKTLEQHDTRSFVINLTNKGKVVAEKTSLFTKELRNPIDKLQQEDKENILLSLFEVIRHLNKTKIINIQRMCITCSYYEYANEGSKHFCKLLNQSLHNNELRIDCPEHLLKA